MLYHYNVLTYRHKIPKLNNSMKATDILKRF